MALRVVLDTNIIVSGLAYTGNEHRVMQAGRDGQVEVVLCEVVIQEAFRVLSGKFGWSTVYTDQELRQLRGHAIVLDPPPSADLIPQGHPDNRILDCAVFAQADYLVTGDRKHLLPLGEYEGVKILRAPDFMEILEAEQ